MRIIVRYNEPWDDSLKLYISYRDPLTRKTMVLSSKCLEFIEVPEGLLSSSLEFPIELFEDMGIKPKAVLENLQEQLIAMGIVPPEYNADKGELKATKYHLEDMRKIAKLK